MYAYLFLYLFKCEMQSPYNKLELGHPLLKMLSTGESGIQHTTMYSNDVKYLFHILLDFVKSVKPLGLFHSKMHNNPFQPGKLYFIMTAAVLPNIYSYFVSLKQ